ncbi:MAG TPA: L,D-transpeptidase family protein [Solirubrobacteraceae bacterium]|jgi:lipoprotein-anchoring transpeptidase ErfK/SrfK|nr:L,D-transpeptidase family protein [Solirubrobacteraceae bacterium]
MSASTIAPPSGPPTPPRRNRLPLVAGLVVGAIVLLAAAMFIYDHARRDRIARGVSIAGVPVGGLSEADARAKIERDLISELNRPVKIHSGSHRWTLSARRAGVTVDAANMVSQAVEASRQGSIFTRTVRGLTGGGVHRDVPLVISYSHGSISKLTAQIRITVNRAPRDATVTPGASGLEQVPSAVGLTVENDKLGGRITHALTATGAARSISVPARPVQPAVTTAQLTDKYPAYIVVNRNEFKLRFYDHLKLSKTYDVAVGMEGLETPAGLHHIEWEQVDPPWYVPKKAWAGKLAGTVVPPGPDDPLKARFMSIEGGAGIHGIDPSEYDSIGHDASHGCVRMRIPDVIALYEKSPVGTPVYII